MRAQHHTEAMLGWWSWCGIERVDIALRKPNASMVWHRDQPLDRLPLPWARSLNVRRADVYIRPARGYSWPLALLDDVPKEMATRVARKYAALLVHTSPAGGCHVWLRCSDLLDEMARREAQRWLAQRIGADLGSISGEHLGRLAGFKNWKRQGVWVNVLAATTHPPAWDPPADLPRAQTDRPGLSPIRHDTSARMPRHGGLDHSPSGLDWGRTCAALEQGLDPESVYQELIEHARARRGRDAQRYARRTLDQAILHLERRRSIRSPNPSHPYNDPTTAPPPGGREEVDAVPMPLMGKCNCRRGKM